MLRYPLFGSFLSSFEQPPITERTVETTKNFYRVENPYPQVHTHRILSTYEPRSAQSGSQLETQRLPDVKPFCHICCKDFATKSSLKVHMRIHLGEKPFKCQYCGKCFTQSGNLTIHVRVHTGEKPFACQVCHKRFTQLTAMKNHMRTLHMQNRNLKKETKRVEKEAFLPYPIQFTQNNYNGPIII